MCARLYSVFNNEMFLEKISNFTARWLLCGYKCIPDHPSNDEPPTNQLPPPREEREQQDDATTQDPHGGTQMVQKHQCTESPAPGDEEKLNIMHQVVAAIAAFLPQGQNIFLRNGQCSECNSEQSKLSACYDCLGHHGPDLFPGAKFQLF